ncbi:DUF2274 domain-containing protein [Nitratireductor sp. XY-223]|uniref:DUF2274 domain-containing protein n=1 Tax=Nitratireductor sp. XY-223 TaxID=2561926 RepID=UPI0010AA6913|nr:DUF2274 domain-containing protein [Nitratireductor sp. XY-223]
MTQLKLGPLPKVETVRVSVTMETTLKEALDLYAADYAELYEPVEAAVLIPHMLEAFLRSDRAFMKRHSNPVRKRRDQSDLRARNGVTTPD